MEGTTFGNVPISCEVKLEVWDSPNSAGVVIDAIRCAKLALDRGIGGALYGPCSYFMKSPPRQCSDCEAKLWTEAFIDGEAEPSEQEPMPRSRSVAAAHNGRRRRATFRQGNQANPGPLDSACL
jgi:myo-inositol-1-phosphate synthase